MYKHKLNACNQDYPRRQRDAVIDSIEKKYGLSNLRHRTIKTDLPKTKATVEIVLFPFGNMLMSLLTDPVGMQPENLLLDPSNPFREPKYGGDNGQFLDDINTGEKFVEAHRLYCHTKVTFWHPSFSLSTSHIWTCTPS